MKEITLKIPDNKDIVWENGSIKLITKSPITERVKTFEDACNELGKYHLLVQQCYKNLYHTLSEPTRDITAYIRLRIITAALNEGWKPKFTVDEKRYYPWFFFYTQEEYDKMDDEDKSHCVVWSGNIGNASYDFVYVDAPFLYAHFGSGLAFKSKELAEYAGKQFIKEWVDYILT